MKCRKSILPTPATITERQKRVLIDVYTSFVKENEKATTNGKPHYDNAKPSQGGENDGSQGNLS